LRSGSNSYPSSFLRTIAVYLLKHHRHILIRAATGFGVTFAITWGPAIGTEWDGLQRNVLGYAGINDRPGGLVRFADSLGWQWGSQLMIGPGRFLILLSCALIPAALTWQRPRLAMESVAMSLVTFLILSPAFGVQYLAWAVAAAYLLDFWFATLYNVLGGLLLYLIYDYWNGGLPWFQMAKGQVFTPLEVALAALLWVVLTAVAGRGAHRGFTDGNDHNQEAGRCELTNDHDQA